MKNALIFLCLIACARADYIFNGTAIGGEVGNQFTTGYAFTVGSDALSVTQLGAAGVNFDGAQGFAAPLQVGLWTNTGTLLASVTFPGNFTPLPTDHGFAWASLGSPVLLTPRTTYVLGDESGGSDPSFYGDANGNDGLDTVGFPDSFPSTAINYLGEVTNSNGNFGGGTFSFPDSGLIGNRALFLGPNLNFDVESGATVPEPATLGAAVGVTTILAAWARRRRGKRRAAL